MTETLVEQMEGSRIPKTPQKANGVCGNFCLDVEASTFNICKNCGAPKREHVKFCRATDELRGKLDKREMINTSSSTVSASSEVACSRFRRDLSGTTFDMCICGFQKKAHEIKALTHGAGDELAKKLSKSAKSESASSETLEIPNRKRACQCAGCAIL